MQEAAYIVRSDAVQIGPRRVAVPRFADLLIRDWGLRDLQVEQEGRVQIRHWAPWRRVGWWMATQIARWHQRPAPLARGYITIRNCTLRLTGTGPQTGFLIDARNVAIIGCTAIGPDIGPHI